MSRTRISRVMCHGGRRAPVFREVVTMCKRWSFALLLGAVACLAGVTAAGAGGNISGCVTAADGTTPVVDYKVTAWRKESFIWWGTRAYTSAGGTYSFLGLADGTYRVEFSPRYDGAYAQETYDDSPLLSGGTDLVITNGANFTNINARLAPASYIAGTVYAPGGGPGIGGVRVSAYRKDGSFGWRGYGPTETSDASGAYAVGGLSPGTYRVEFDETEGDYLDQVYRNAASLESGTDIVVPATATVGSIDAILAMAGKISGHVYASNGVPLDDGYVTASHWDGSFWNSAGELGSCDAGGFYTVGGLSSGTYRVEFNTYDDFMLDEVYDNAIELDSGRDVAVLAGTTTSNIDAVIDQPAWPPRMVRIRPEADVVWVYYTATDDAVCVVQSAGSLSGPWQNVDTNQYISKGVNQSWCYNPGGTDRFWRVQAP